MSYLNIFLLLTALLYFVGLIIFFIGLYFPNRNRQNKLYKVSVIIAARNEENTIGHLLADLTEQTYSKEHYEVIVVNDHSEDETAKVIQAYVDQYANIQLMNISTVEKGLTAKKNAIHQGIQRSQGEIILSVDADCRIQPPWIETMVSYFIPDVGMVVGFSQLGQRGDKRSLFQKLQALDFLSLLSASQGSLNIGIPLAATGQNLAYRRKVFEEIGGFSRIGHRISGDDVLLLQLIHKHTHWKIRFAHSEKCYNYSLPESTLREFFLQRIRWASNGSYQFRLNKGFFAYVINTFLMNLFILIAFPMGLITSNSLSIPFIALGLKSLAELCITLKGMQVYRRFDLLTVFPIWFFLQIPYVVFVGIIGSMGQFSWKNRNHKSYWGKSIETD